MSILDELENLAGPTSRLTLKTKRSGKNKIREIDGKVERLCCLCETWQIDEMFGWTKIVGPNGWRKARQAQCRACQAKTSRKRRRGKHE